MSQDALYVAAISRIAVRFFSACDQGDGTYWDKAETVWENAAELLHQLGVLSQDSGGYLAAVAPRDMADHLAGRIPAEDPPLGKVLLVMLDIEGSFLDGLATERAPFEPLLDCAHLADALVGAGYALRVGDKIAWTNKIAPQMTALGLWRSDGQSHAAYERARALDAVRKIRPHLTAQQESRMRWSVIDAVKIVRVHWDGARWSETERGQERWIGLRESKAIAEGLVALLKAEGTQQ